MSDNANEYSDIQKQIVSSSLQDYQDWVDEWADVIKTANDIGDTKGIYRAVKMLEAKHERPPKNLLKTSPQTHTVTCWLGSAQDVAAVWEKFLANKFSATVKEREERPDMEELPCTAGTGALTDQEFDKGLAKMKANKASGPDQIPAELYKRSKLCNDLLRETLKKIWLTKEVPTEFACATYIMLYKNKGSSDDPSKQV